MNVLTSFDERAALLTVAEVAERLRCSEPTVRRRIRDGELPAHRLGEGRSALRVRENELEAWLDRHPAGGDAA
jgi:excisionase family DNA binding protein